MREGKVMASGSEGGGSADVALRWKKYRISPVTKRESFRSSQFNRLKK